MNFKKISENKKLKNILITLGEILVVAAIIFGALMFIQNKVSKEADQLSGVENTVNSSPAEKEQEETGTNQYYIEVNIKKNALIVYQYEKDGKTKKPYKIFRSSAGKNLETGKYKLSGRYSWLDIDGDWHQYNTRFDTKAWIQSAGYRDKYANTIKKDSYRAVGNERVAGCAILLYAGDAEWIYSNCKEGTVVHVVKGKKSDKLPLDFEQTVNPYKYCGWDPTDPDKNNPYQKMENGKIVAGASTVYVERGEKPEYLSNLLAKDENGNNVTGDLKYKTFSTDETGTYQVKFSYKTASGTKITVRQKFKVVDTICPVVTCSKKQFTYEVKSLAEKDMNKKSNVTAIENMVRSCVSCNESGVTITVSMADADELWEGNFPVVIKAQDRAGNIGSCQVMCEIKVKEEETKKRTNSKKQWEKLQKEKETEKVTKKKTKKKENETEQETSESEAAAGEKE